MRSQTARSVLLLLKQPLGRDPATFRCPAQLSEGGGTDPHEGPGRPGMLVFIVCFCFFCMHALIMH